MQRTCTVPHICNVNKDFCRNDEITPKLFEKQYHSLSKIISQSLNCCNIFISLEKHGISEALSALKLCRSTGAEKFDSFFKNKQAKKRSLGWDLKKMRVLT